MKIFTGTEKMPRYPHIEGSELLGVLCYGTVKLKDGSIAYKADPNAFIRLGAAGWKKVGRGSSYAYYQYSGEKTDY